MTKTLIKSANGVRQGSFAELQESAPRWFPKHGTVHCMGDWVQHLAKVYFNMFLPEYFHDEKSFESLFKWVGGAKGYESLKLERLIKDDFRHGSHGIVIDRYKGDPVKPYSVVHAMHRLVSKGVLTFPASDIEASEPEDAEFEPSAASNSVPVQEELFASKRGFDLKSLIKSAKEMKFQLFDTGAFKLDLSQEKDGSLLCSTIKGTCNAGAVLSVAGRDGYTFQDLSQGVDLSSSPLIEEYKSLLVSTAVIKSGEQKPVNRNLDAWVVSGKGLDKELQQWGLDNPGHVFQSMQVIGADLDGGGSYKVFGKPLSSSGSYVRGYKSKYGEPCLHLGSPLLDDFISLYTKANAAGESIPSEGLIVRNAINYGWNEDDAIEIAQIVLDELGGTQKTPFTASAKPASLGFKKPLTSTGKRRSVASYVASSVNSSMGDDIDEDIYPSNEQIEKWNSEGGNTFDTSGYPPLEYPAQNDLDRPHAKKGESQEELDAEYDELTPQQKEENIRRKVKSASLGFKKPVVSTGNGRLIASSVNSPMGDYIDGEEPEPYYPGEDSEVDEFYAQKDLDIGGSDVDRAIQYVVDNNIPHNFEHVYEALINSGLFSADTPNAENDVFDIAFLVCEDLGVAVASNYPIKRSAASSIRTPIQQDLKGIVSMVKNWLQRLHEGLMEQSVFYQNLMRLLKGNGYPGSKANSIYEGLMAGQPVEAVLASLKRVRSSASRQPIMSAKTKAQSQMIQEHMLNYFDSYEDLLSEAQYAKENLRHGLFEFVEGGAFSCYYDEVREFLNSLYGSSGDNYSDDIVWQRYVNLLVMELENILRNPDGGGKNYIADTETRDLFVERDSGGFPQPVA